MIPLHAEEFFTFRFVDDRLVGRFHLTDALPGRRAVVVDLAGELIAEAVVGAGGWVELAAPLVVRAGGGFRVRVESPCD